MVVLLFLCSRFFLINGGCSQLSFIQPRIYSLGLMCALTKLIRMPQFVSLS